MNQKLEGVDGTDSAQNRNTAYMLGKGRCPRGNEAFYIVSLIGKVLYKFISLNLKANQKITIDSENVAHRSFTVRAMDVDLYFQASIPFYFSIIQEITAEHTTSRDIGIEDLYRDYKYTWVVAREKIDFISHPRWMENVDLISWAQPNIRLHCPRSVQGYVDNKPIFNAMTMWAVVDPARKRPIRPQPILDILGIADPDKYFMDPVFEQMPLWDEIDKLSILPSFIARPNFSDVDVNGHVNNVSYIQWLQNAMDREFLSEHEPLTMDVIWERQTFADDEVKVDTALISEHDGKYRFLHRMTNGKGVTVFSATSEWSERKVKYHPLGKML